mmetsp:Transcript_23666/g.89856  ORF Transcript_23666/g.89856 Transcript_23666/m.89856 type:complete len:239 (+) Transcript_23666:7870-8586(+)
MGARLPRVRSHDQDGRGLGKRHFLHGAGLGVCSRPPLGGGGRLPARLRLQVLCNGGQLRPPQAAGADRPGRRGHHATGRRRAVGGDFPVAPSRPRGGGSDAQGGPERRPPVHQLSHGSALRLPHLLGVRRRASEPERHARTPHGALAHGGQPQFPALERPRLHALCVRRLGREHQPEPRDSRRRAGSRLGLAPVGHWRRHSPRRHHPRCRRGAVRVCGVAGCAREPSKRNGAAVLGGD